jgi:hypothetical protein
LAGGKPVGRNANRSGVRAPHPKIIRTEAGGRSCLRQDGVGEGGGNGHDARLAAAGRARPAWMPSTNGRMGQQGWAKGQRSAASGLPLSPIPGGPSDHGAGPGVRIPRGTGVSQLGVQKAGQDARLNIAGRMPMPRSGMRDAGSNHTGMAERPVPGQDGVSAGTHRGLPETPAIPVALPAFAPAIPQLTGAISGFFPENRPSPFFSPSFFST